MTKKLKYTELRSLDSAIEQLQQVLDGLRAGVLCLERGEQQLQLKPGAVLDFSLHAEQKGVQERFELALEWRRQELTIGTHRSGSSSVSEPESTLIPPAACGALRTETARLFAEEDTEPLSSDDDDIVYSDVDELGTRRPSISVTSDAAASQAQDEIDDEAVTVRHSSPPGGQLRASQPALRSDAEWFERLYREARTLSSDDRLRLDEKRFADSLVAAGLEPQLQQELFSLARQADVEGRDRLFKEHSISELIASTLGGAA